MSETDQEKIRRLAEERRQLQEEIAQMDHRIVDAINKAYDDEVSRLFAEFCTRTDDNNQDFPYVLGKLGDGMENARKARDMALVEMRRRAHMRHRERMAKEPIKSDAIYLSDESDND
jgi:hypothetical protein